MKFGEKRFIKIYNNSFSYVRHVIFCYQRLSLYVVVIHIAQNAHEIAHIVFVGPKIKEKIQEKILLCKF